jgi:mono/diheme cytochrome c family protein
VLGYRLLFAAVLLALVGGGAFWLLTAPDRLDATTLAALPEGDAARGEMVFWAGGCASCHAADKASGEEKLRLGGGRRFASDFGTFVAPNISSDPEDGIGAWSTADLANAMLRGVSPDGRHYYPAFPYTSYTRMDVGDVADLRAYLATLPAVSGRAPDHELAFPFTLRRGLGLWKRVFLSDTPVIAVDESDPALVRGRYLVEGPGHCGECHTPRNFAGGLETSRWMAGAPNPDGDGRIPNVTPGAGGIDWSAGDIAYYLETGFTPEFDSVGGSMLAVQQNMAMLPAADRDAIAAYIVALPPQDSRAPGGG